ncbi:esterase-like activity of phytase family protein [Paracoccus luteus]|uniref:esterase-like activity of phytase family protein n=1 Tax=Paracoccus luteus TaxID=2508543 RepID=UPI001FED05D4|nr:esterase-like activity of phytase family protein [Paracoccus luteus]
MPGPRRALIAAAAVGAAMLAGPAPPSANAAAAASGAVVDYLGTYVWRGLDDDFGGFSGIELDADGRRYTALSDRGTVRWGSVDRDGQGRIRGLTTAGTARLQDSGGRKLRAGYLGDAEGLAIDAQGRLFVSFEGLDRIARFDTPDSPAVRIPPAREFARMRPNAGLEALAVTPGGDILTIPESWDDDDEGFPVLRRSGNEWSVPFRIPRLGSFVPVGADVGPDGRLYLLERAFKGVRGFASRVRRFDMTGATLSAGEVLIETGFLRHDNLEGIAVWQDAQGIRLTMISDDNFLFVQRTELVEYRVRD